MKSKNERIFYQIFARWLKLHGYFPYFRHYMYAYPDNKYTLKKFFNEYPYACGYINEEMRSMMNHAPFVFDLKTSYFGRSTCREQVLADYNHFIKCFCAIPIS